MSPACFAFPTPIPLSSLSSTQLPTTQNRSVARHPSAPLTRSMQPPRATIAIPSDPVHATPEVPETPDADSAPWMPLPGVVHTIATPEQFDVLRSTAGDANALLVADFMASWCRKCIYLLPRLRKAAERFPTAYFCTVDVNKVRRLPKEFGIAKMPTFIVLRNSERVETLVGGATPPKVAESLTKMIEKHCEAS